ncbi:MAG TPA: DUF4157 domain-containing protein [Motilibacterales bacterium]|nr:DUF4157 domain-containing protein [Motilibacterales bacterium]
MPNFDRPERLERIADDIAHETLARASDAPLTPVPGLDVNHAKRTVGERIGADLSDVTVRPGALSGAPSGTLARALSTSVEVRGDVYRPDTPIGQALLAHEFTHVVQQDEAARLPNGPRNGHRDHSRRLGTAPPGMAQHCTDCGSSCNSSHAPPAPTAAAATTFTDVQRVFAASAEPAARATSLTAGIATARAVASRLYRTADRAPISTLRAQYERETGATISANPFIGVSQDHVERAYRAWAENPGAAVEPWVLLAVWVKEGLTETAAPSAGISGFPAASATDARAIFRSMLYFQNLGADVYIAHTAVAGSDNAASFASGTGAAHDTAFAAAVARQVSAGRLPRNLVAEINAEVRVASAGPGQYTAAVTPRFYELSLLLVDAFYREQRQALAADARVGGNPDPGLVYMRWNMRASSFNAFLNRAPNSDADGSVPSRETWAFHRPVAEAEYGQSRRNAIRFKYLLEVFQHVYQDQP